MKSTIVFIFICAAVEGSGKHRFFPQLKTWFDAQAFCREHHTDLSFVTSQREQNMLDTAAGERSLVGWIGLHKDSPTSSVWKWSGGGNVTYSNWDSGQPDHYHVDDIVVLSGKGGKWHDWNPQAMVHFHCFSLSAVEVKKTWEEALEYCRETHTDLTTLQSDTEQLMTLGAIQHDHFTARVWIGLRFLGDHWLWVNGDPMVYENWRKGDQEHQCPLRKRCGALTKQGHWENWDCEDQLSFICY